jgi:murein L,D-transpeptidase YcbB/YkuD
MKSLRAKRFLLPLTAFAALGLAMPQANAQGFFDMLFGGQTRKHQPLRGEFPPPPPKRKAASGGGAHIASPTYNTYRADRLVRVDFSALTVPATTGATTQNIAFDASAAASASFGQALSGLDDYELLAESDVGKALIAYYSANPDFIWVTGSSPNDRAQQALRVLGEAASYGLTPDDYTVEVPSAASTSVDPEARTKELIRFEMALSARVLRYVHDAQDGRIDPNRISTGYYDFPAKPLDMQAVLGALAHTQEVRAYLESRHPQNPEYQALRVELEALEASAATVRGPMTPSSFWPAFFCAALMTGTSSGT